MCEGLKKVSHLRQTRRLQYYECIMSLIFKLVLMNGTQRTVLKTVCSPAECIQPHVALKMFVFCFYFLHGCEISDAARSDWYTLHNIYIFFGLVFSLEIPQCLTLKHFLKNVHQ